jgi:hypothetical protein
MNDTHTHLITEHNNKLTEEGIDDNPRQSVLTTNTYNTYTYLNRSIINKSLISQSISNFIKSDDKLIENLKNYLDDFMKDKNLNDFVISDKYLIEVLKNNSKNIVNYEIIINNFFIFLDYTLINDAQTDKKENFIKQVYIKPGVTNHNKIYKAEILLDVDKNYATEYLRNVENLIKFNKFLKDVVVLKENTDLNCSIQYHIYDYRMFRKLRDFVLVESFRELNYDVNSKTKSIYVISFNSLNVNSNNFSSNTFNNTSNSVVFFLI